MTPTTMTGPRKIPRMIPITIRNVRSGLSFSGGGTGVHRTCIFPVTSSFTTWQLSLVPTVVRSGASCSLAVSMDSLGVSPVAQMASLQASKAEAKPCAGGPAAVALLGAAAGETRLAAEDLALRSCSGKRCCNASCDVRSSLHIIRGTQTAADASKTAIQNHQPLGPAALVATACIRPHLHPSMLHVGCTQAISEPTRVSHCVLPCWPVVGDAAACFAV